MKKLSMNNELCYKNLANAIILQAIQDWKDCKKNEKGEFVHPKDGKTTRKEIELFFRSDWFKALTDIDAEYIIRMLHEAEKSA